MRLRPILLAVVIAGLFSLSGLVPATWVAPHSPDAASLAAADLPSTLGMARSAGLQGAPPAPPAIPSVGSTYVALNDTVVAGNFKPYNFVDVNALAVDPARGLLYLAASGYGPADSGVDVLNLSTDEVTSVIPLPTLAGPTAALFDPTNNTLYIADSGLGRVSVINTTTNRPVATLVAGNSANSTEAFARDSANGDVFLAGGDGVLSVLNPVTQRVQTNRSFGSNLAAVAYDARTNEVIVQDNASSNASVFYAGNLSYVGSVAYPLTPSGMIVAPDGSTFYLASGTGGGASARGNLTAVNATSLTATTTLGFAGRPYGMAVEPANDTLFIGTGTPSLVVINLTSRSFLPAVTAGTEAYSLAYDPIAHALDVASPWNGSVLSGPSYSTVGHFQTGENVSTVISDPMAGRGFLSTDGTTGVSLNLSGPRRTAGFFQSDPTTTLPYFTAMVYAPPFDRLFIATAFGVRVDNASTGQLIRNIGGFNCLPFGVTYDPENEYVYVDNFCAPGGYVTVLDASSLATVATILFAGSPNTVGWDGATGDLWIQNNTAAGYSGNISVIDPATDRRVGYVPLPARGPATAIAFDPVANAMVVEEAEACPTCASYLLAYNATTGALNASYLLRTSGEADIAYLSGTAELAMATSATDNLTFLSATNLTILGNVSVGRNPRSLSYDPATGVLYAANQYGGTVSILPTNSTGAPYVSSFSGVPRSILVGGSVTFDTVAEGWNGSLSYTYSGLPGGCHSANVSTFSCSPSGPGTFRVAAVVTDGAGRTTTAYTDLRVSAVIPLTINSFLAQPTPITLGATTTFQVAVGGAVGWIGYVYGGLPTGCYTQNASTLACTPGAVGNFTVEVIVTDSFARHAYANTSLQVKVPLNPTIVSFGAVPSDVQLGNATVFTTVATAGSGWLDYAYDGLPPGCATANLSALRCTPSATGQFNVSVTVTNSYGKSAGASTSVRVTPDFPPTILSFVATPASIYLGRSALITVQAIGRNLSYQYSGLPTPCAAGDITQFTCTPNEAGNYTVTVTVTGYRSLSSAAHLLLTIIAAGRLSVASFTASPATVVLGGSTRLSVSVAGAVGNVSYSYAGLPGGCPSANVSTLACVPSGTGTYTVNASVSDALGRHTFALLTLTVATPGSTTGGGQGSSLASVPWGLVVGGLLGAIAAVVLGVLVWRRRPPPRPFSSVGEEVVGPPGSVAPPRDETDKIYGAP